MRILTIVGLVLIAIGIVGLVYGGITYRSSRDVIDVGSMHLQVDQSREIPFSPIAGAVAVVIGITLIVVDRRRSSRPPG